MMKRFFCKVILNREGRLRTGWKLAGGVAAYFAAFCGVLYSLAALFGELFDVWGLTADNLLSAPQWAQSIVRWHTDFCYSAAYLAGAVVGILLARRWNRTSAGRCRHAPTYAALAGFAVGIGLTTVAIGFDCMRLERPFSEPVLQPAQLAAALVIVVGKISAEVLSKRLVFDVMRTRWLAYLAASLVSLLLLRSAANGLGIVNAVLLSIASCALYERGGLAASAALTAAWTVWTSLVFGFPGMTVSVSPVYALYHVSDGWLTGGNARPDCGLWMTLALALIDVFLLKKEICTLARGMGSRVMKNVDGNTDRKTAPASAGCKRR